MISPDNVISIALMEEGYVEKSKESYVKNKLVIYNKFDGAGKDNITKYGYEMHGIYPQTMDFPAAWCDCFVDWCFVKAFGEYKAKELLYGFDDYTVNSASKYKNHNRWFTKNPVPGDQIFFSNGIRICHTGLVYKVDKRYIYTIEGNTSAKETLVSNGGMVAKKKYSINYGKISGFGRPLYDIPASCQPGDYNKNVLYLQQRLMAKGYPLPRYGADGDYGDETSRAVKMFRHDNDLPASVICDSECWDKLI